MLHQRIRLRRICSLLAAGCVLWTSMPLTAFAADTAESGIAITEENFPDANFRAYLSENLDTNGDEMLSDTERLVFTLDVSSQGIADLGGIAYFPTLIALDCSENALSELDLSALTLLQTLNCADNALTELDVSQQSMLTNLDCSGNALSELDVSALTLLQTLDCADNVLTELNVSALAVLQTLDGSNNLLESLDVSENQALTTLRLANNRMVAVDVTGLSMEELNTAENRRDIVPVATGVGEYAYSLSELPELDASRVLAWENAAVSGNMLQFAGDTKEICYSYQADRDAAVPVATFTLQVQADSEKYLEISEENFPDAALREQLALSDTDGNGWFSIAELQELTTLTLSANCGVTNFQGLEKLVWLETLDCSGVPLSAVDFTALSRLKTLVCDGCGITELYLPTDSSLESLSCADNALTALDLQEQSCLQYLNCSDNRLCTLQIDGTALHADAIVATGNSVSVNADLYGRCDLTQLSGFPVEMVDEESWTGGTVDGNLLTLDDSTDTDVTYAYYVDSEKTQTVAFTLAVHVDTADLALDASSFPDSGFRDALSAYDSNADGALSRTELEAVTELDLSNSTVWDLTGIEYFTNLERLDCADCNLRKLDVSALSHLKYLDCARNALEQLMLPKSGTLEELDCTGNGNLTELDVRRLTNLRVLSCAQCALRELDLTQAVHLESLNCLMNGLTVLKIAGLSELTVLNCSTNQLSELDLGGVTALETLRCASNQLTELDLSDCAALQLLNCTSNQLTELELSAQTALETLLCSGNRLTSLQTAAGVTLQKLSAVHNSNTVSADADNGVRFADLPGDFQVSRVEESSWTNAYADGDAVYAIDPTQKITYVYLTEEGNPNSGVTFTLNLRKQNTGVPVDAAHFPDAAFRGIVEAYDTDGDGLLSSMELAAVTDMDISGCGISNLMGITYFTALKTLHCENNPALTTLSVITLSKLQALYCANDALTTIYFSRNGALKILDCSGNALTALNFSDMDTLTVLNCADNELKTLDVTGLTALTELNCGGNQLTALNLAANTALTILDCNENQLQQLDVSALTQLETLSCEKNQLIALDVTGLDALRSLDAAGNSRTISVNAMYRADLETLSDDFLSERVAVDAWENATCDGIMLQVTDIAATVTYAYCVDATNASRIVTFTLIPETAEEESIAIDATTFPDAALRAAVKKQSDHNGDGLLQVSEQEAVTALDISSCGISDITGLSVFSNLRELNCADNSILNFYALPETLEILDCSGNIVTKWIVSGLPNLTSLSCRRMQLSELDVTALTALEKLDCGENCLTELPLYNTKLTALLCDQNQLTELDLSKCTLLESLDCHENALTSMTFRGNALQSLNCADNALQSLRMDTQTNLVQLECSGNRLGTLQLTAQKSLDKLYAGLNPLLSLYLSPNAPMSDYNLDGCTAEQALQCVGDTVYYDTAKWSSFLPKNVIAWSNAQADNAKVYPEEPLSAVTYTFQTGNSRVTAAFTVTPSEIPMRAVSVSLEDAESKIYYTGLPQTPHMLVQLGNTTLQAGEDYTLSYAGNVNAGTGVVTVIAAENSTLWTGSKTMQFQIEKAVPNVAIIWNSSNIYTEGDALPILTLSDSDVPVTLSWDSDAPDTLEAGLNELHWKAVPTDSDNYETIRGTITVTAAEKPVTTTSMVETTAEPTQTTTTATTETEAPITTQMPITTTVTTTAGYTTTSKMTTRATTTTEEDWVLTGRATTSKMTTCATTTTEEDWVLTGRTTTSVSATASEMTWVFTKHPVTTTSAVTTETTTVSEMQSSTVDLTTASSQTTTTAMQTGTTLATSATTVTTVSESTTSSTSGKKKQTPKSMGDINADGEVDSRDLQELLYYVARKSAGFENVVFDEDPEVNQWIIAAADIDYNQELDSSDILYLLIYIAYNGAGKDVTWKEALRIGKGG